MPTLNIKETFAKLREQYDDKRESFNALLLGDTGSGKTHSLKTCRLPLGLFMFDPGGEITLSQEIESGEVVVMDYSQDDPVNPTEFKRFFKDFYEMKISGVLEHFGTIGLDSLTTWGDSLMNAILKDNGRPVTKDLRLRHSSGSIVAIPELRDYQIQMATMTQCLQAMLSMPCDFIAVAHIARDKDEVTGRMVSGPMVTGKLSAKLPLLFDEVYVAEAEPSSKGVNYHFLTAPSGIHKPRTRMGANGKLNAKEEPSFKNILKKCGREFADLPLYN